ncbi:MAG: restriction endonuclease subunit S [Gammaproteobacteria bacterium]|nr:restriction endonuclease subunit S [Gammaproteobacteria bacterium]
MSDKKIKITDIVDFNPKRLVKKGSVAPFVDMAALSVDSRNIDTIGEREFKGSGSKFLNGDTLFSRITPCLENGKTAKVSGLPDGVAASGSTEFIVMAAKESKFDEDFVYYLARLPEFRTYAQARMEGTSGRQRVPWQSLSEFVFDFPKKEKRKEIGTFLKNIDDKIECNRQINQTLENIAQEIFKSWFVDFEPTRAKIAAKQNGQDSERAAMAAISGKSVEELNQLTSEQQQSLKTAAALFPDTLADSELGEIPGGWELKPLEDIAENHSTTFDFSTVDKVVFINTGDVLEGLFLHKNYSSKEGLPGQAKKTIKKNDILYSEIRPKNKRFAYVVEDCDDYVVSTKFMIIRSLGFVHPRYLYQVLRQETTIREFNLIAESRSGTFPQITFDSISYVPVVVPSEEIQKVFMTFFNPIIEKIDIVVGENKNLAKLRDTILPQLFSGELGTENAN